MNNSQFRKLVLETPARQGQSSGNGVGSGSTSRRDGGSATPSLGSRARSSIPMTPRSLASGGGIDFARQLAERNAATQPVKKFRSSAAPKGAKLAEGYTDRTKTRNDEDEDDKANRVKALEEMMRLQQIDRSTFEKLRDEIVGGEAETTHLVKGLDWKLLERVRRGEDVLSNEKTVEDVGSGVVHYEGNVDEELEKLEDQEVISKTRDTISKKGTMAPPSLVPGKKRNRDQILAELKAARLAVREAAQPSLGARFKKVGIPRDSSRIEIDEKGREILIVIDENGKEKRKIRKSMPPPDASSGKPKNHGLLMPDKDATPLGMEVPEITKAAEEDEDLDIFGDAGDDYDPLAGLDSGVDSESDSDADVKAEEAAAENDTRKTSDSVNNEKSDMPPPSSPRSQNPPTRRNYFNDPASASTEANQDQNKSPALRDPTILAALRKAAALEPLANAAGNEEDRARALRHKRMLEADDRDAQDLDIGFGSSRLGDDDEGEEKNRISAWDGDRDGGKGERGDGEGKTKRKRGPKKRKGNGENAEDVMRVLESRKAAK